MAGRLKGHWEQGQTEANCYLWFLRWRKTDTQTLGAQTVYDHGEVKLQIVV